MRIIFIIAATTLVAINTLWAQEGSKEFQKHEFSVGLIGGIHTLDYDLSKGKQSKPFSGGIGVGYTYFFKKNIGLATGLDLAFYNTKVTLDELVGNHTAFDHYSQEYFDFNYTLRNYEEKQNALFINIPIMLHYQFTDGESVKFYAAGGGKIGLPISGKYKSEGADLSTYGYYPDSDVTLTSQTFRGFGDFATRKQDNEQKYKMSFSLAVELGAKWRLPNDLSLYTGAYMDYGLNDIHKKDKQQGQHLVMYNEMNPESHIFNGIANSSHVQNGEMRTMVDKVNLLAYGLKVRLAFGK